MTFHQESTHLYKTALSELQGAWQNLRETVVEHHPFKESQRLLFQIDEGMSWEADRDLEYMRKILLVVRNIATQAKASADIMECIQIVWQDLEEVFEAIAEGEIG